MDDIQKLLCQEQEADVEGQRYKVRNGKLELVGGSEFNGYGSEKAPLKASTPEHLKDPQSPLTLTLMPDTTLWYNTEDNTTLVDIKDSFTLTGVSSMADEYITGAEDGPFNEFLGRLDCLRSELEEEKPKLDDIQKLLRQEQEADVEG